MIRTKGGGNTDVIQIHNLIVANFGVLCFSGDDKLMASGYRNLQKEVKTQQRKENRQSDWAKYLEGREKEPGRTSIPSLIRPVLISGPFCHAGISIDSRQNHDSEVCSGTGQTVSRAMATGRPSGSAAERMNPLKLALQTVGRIQKKKKKRYQQSFYECYL